ncbi:MAG: DUF885 family protein [Deltaproteobacteria bacterium]|nr:DUF885 family protein [Deltaproteobacteria bacterium]
MNEKDSVETICQEMFGELAQNFPVSCASDEFYYFPQIKHPEPDWSVWDRFSPGTVSEFAHRLSLWEGRFDRLLLSEKDPETLAEISLYKKAARTLREQLSDVRTWQRQPTFYLTLVCIGLAEALEDEDPGAKHERAGTVAEYLDEVSHNMTDVPLLFLDMGQEMVSDTRNYLVLLSQELTELKPAFDALDRFNERLLAVSTREDFLLPRELLELIFRFHLACDMGIDEVEYTLDEEIRETEATLEREAGSLSYGIGLDHKVRWKWPDVLESIPIPALGKNGIVGFYREEVARLAAHCLKEGWISEEFVASCPVRVAPTPPSLSAIRAASSYSIPPKHPPTGGVFYVINTNVSDAAYRENYREYRMLCAHETYPGHHLLDASRWSMENPFLRTVEQPLFYEGWACFSEKIMKLTGYYTDPADSLLLAKRRLWHAVRGKVDIGLQTGTMDVLAAAEYLTKSGISAKRAGDAARRYPLNPGYQQCYTIGERRFRNLYEKYGGNDLQRFVKTILSGGEIALADLEKKLKGKTADGGT